MIFKIDEFGNLCIMRREHMSLNMSCCYKPKRICSDACSLFGEPENLGEYTELELCTKTIVCQTKDFTDEREASHG
jgi:hypothetical protein